ncbi:MAG: Transposase domain [Magnetococcales bacterium]|nr:Transposase domain [Magnetococcales bacterium]HIJ83051.1 transposase [Magnetococcales bacterium]
MYWLTIQGNLFPWLEEEIGPLTKKQKQLVTVLEMVRLEEFLRSWLGLVGRPLSDRAALAQSFIAKAVYQIKTTRMLIDRLKSDKKLRRLCGWESKNQIPSESTFSRAFAEFAESELPTRVHKALIEETHEDRLVGHILRDSTAIEVREKPERIVKTEKPKGKPGRPKKGEERPKEERRLERQKDMSLLQMLSDLPHQCNVGTKVDSKGYKITWSGYKLHVDVADGGIPISLVLTSASLHDSQVAIPLATITNERVTSLYDLMDSAYDAPEIKEHSRSLGHVPIIDINPRRTPGLKQELLDEAKRLKLVGHQLAEDVRYNERSGAERFNDRIKNDFGGKEIWVRGNKKVMCHLMFGILALTVDQLMRLIT